MSSLGETDAMAEAKIAAIMEPYRKAGIITENCTLNGILKYFILPTDFQKKNKILHHFIREDIFPQLMSRANAKGIISNAGVLNPDDICHLSTWLRKKEGKAVIQEEYGIRKLKRNAAKLLQKEASSVGEELKRKIVDDDDNDMARNEVKRAKMLETEGTSS